MMEASALERREAAKVRSYWPTDVGAMEMEPSREQQMGRWVSVQVGNGAFGFCEVVRGRGTCFVERKASETTML